MFLGLLLIGYFSSEFMYTCFNCCWNSSDFLFIHGKKKSAVNTKAVIKGAPWTIVFFSIGMYVVVYGLRNAGLNRILS